MNRNKKNAVESEHTRFVSNRPQIFRLILSKQVPVVSIVIQQKNFDVDQTDEVKRTPLWAAAKVPLYEIVELLLDKGADIRFARNYIQCPLYAALTSPDRKRTDPNKVAHLLIRRGCKLDCKFRDETPLICCAKIGDLETFRLLIKAGCKIPKPDLLRKEDLHASWREDESLMQWISSLRSTPKTLVHLSVCVIRNRLVEKNKNIFPKHVNGLPLPNNLKKCILLED